MFKKFTINCRVANGSSLQNVPIDFLVGDPEDSSHPIANQMKYFSQQGLAVPEDIINSLKSLHEIAKRNRVPFHEILQYVSDQLNMVDVFSNAVKSPVIQKNSSN